MQKASPPPKINKKNKLTPTPSPTIDKDIAKRAKAVFGSDYKDRDVDRALWVYGHMFKK